MLYVDFGEQHLGRIRPLSNVQGQREAHRGAAVIRAHVHRQESLLEAKELHGQPGTAAVVVDVLQLFSATNYSPKNPKKFKRII